MQIKETAIKFLSTPVVIMTKNGGKKIRFFPKQNKINKKTQQQP